MASSKNWLSVNRWGAAPALLFTAACFVAPLIAMALVSLSERSGGHTVLTWTLDNYRGFVSRSDGAFVSALFNSIEVTVTVTVLSVLAAYPLAYMLAYRVPKRLAASGARGIVLPFWTSYVIRSYSWLLVLSENGVINQILLGLGILDGPIGLGNTRSATVLGFVHFFIMLLTLTIYANLVADQAVLPEGGGAISAPAASRPSCM